MTTSPARRRLALVTITATAAAAVVAVIAAWALAPAAPSVPAADPTPSSSPTPATAASPRPVPAVDAGALSALPEARYDAVIGGLLVADTAVPAHADVYSTASDLPLFGDADGTGRPGGSGGPIARLAARDFLGEATPVVVVRIEGSWALVLTPARRTLPSAAPAGQPAAAQTAAWAPLASLAKTTGPTSRVEVSVAQRSVSIVALDGTVQATFPAAVGADGTPTPTGVVGYLEARYVDPSQGTGDQPIHLTSLHSAAADEPFGGHDGGLIGIHYADQRDGAISHGCVRIGADAVAALAALPLGTLVVLR